MARIRIHAQEAAPCWNGKSRAGAQGAAGGTHVKRRQEEPTKQAGRISLTHILPLRMLVPGFKVRC